MNNQVTKQCSSKQCSSKPCSSRVRHALQCLLVIAMTGLSTSVYAGSYVEIAWDDLMPEGWEPTPIEESHEFIGVQLEDAPVVTSMNGRKVKLPGFMLPTKQTMKGVTEFLLVPFLGACIHVPPPPSHQMVFVTLKKPFPAEGLYDPIWVYGEVTTQDQTTEYATASYTMSGASAEPYLYMDP